MANELIYNKWTGFINEEKYKKFFLSNEAEWIDKLNDVKKYIDENGKRPSNKNKEEKIKQFGKWINNQIKNYKSKKYIMANELIHDKWTNIINENNYKKHFLSNEAEWINLLDDVKKYIDENDKRPSTHSKKENIKQLGQWISTQITNYKSKEKSMANELIYDKWTKFINDNNYKEYFLSNEAIWINKLNDVKKYIDENGKRPSKDNKEEKIKQLGQWISRQIKNYKSKEQIMANDLIYDKWTDFISNNKIHF